MIAMTTNNSTNVNARRRIQFSPAAILRNSQEATEHHFMMAVSIGLKRESLKVQNMNNLQSYVTKLRIALHQSLTATVSIRGRLI
jgi:hypothetical protein